MISLNSIHVLRGEIQGPGELTQLLRELRANGEPVFSCQDSHSSRAERFDAFLWYPWVADTYK